MPAPKDSTAFNPAPTVAMVPKRDGRKVVRDATGAAVLEPLAVWYFGDLVVDDCVRALAIEDLIAEAPGMAEQLALAREQVGLLCPEAHPEVLAGLSPAVLREVRRLGFGRDREAPAAAAAEGAGDRPPGAGSPASSETSPVPADSSASPRGAASAA